MAKLLQLLYIVIDVTKIEDTKIRYVAPIKQATLLGQIYMQDHPGRKCVAYALEGRSFSKLDKLALQYLYWNTFGSKPNEDYAELLKDSLAKTLTIPVDESQLASLQALKDLGSQTTQEKVKAPKVSGGLVEKPKKTSTCGFVWEICDKIYAKLGLGLEDKSLRQAVADECEKEGINKSTMGVQFGKWKGSKKSEI